MAEIQQATAGFFVPVAVSYGAALGGWWAAVRAWPGLWPKRITLETDRRWLDLGLMFAAVAGIFGLSLLNGQGYLLPRPTGELGRAVWVVNVVLVFSPMFIVTAARRQGLATLFLSPRKLWNKVGLGLALSIVSVLIFIALRGDWPRLPEIVARATDPALFAQYFIPVLLEGVALAFAFVRLRWALGMWPALLIPAVLFALGHVPGSIQAGESFGHIAAFFVVNSAIVVVILAVVQRTQDVIWLTMVHYFMDIAIEAF